MMRENLYSLVSCKKKTRKKYRVTNMVRQMKVILKKKTDYKSGYKLKKSPPHLICRHKF